MELSKVKNPVKPMDFPSLGIVHNIPDVIKCDKCGEPINIDKEHYVDVSPNPYSYWDSKKFCFKCGDPIYDKQISDRVKAIMNKKPSNVRKMVKYSSFKKVGAK